MVIKVPFNSQPSIGSGRLDGLNPGDANEQGS
jgi:hypothetical protein